QSPSSARLAGRSSRSMICSIVASASASASAGATSPIIDCWIASPMATLTSQGYSGSPIVYGTTSSVITSDQGASAAPGSAFTASATSSRAGALVNCVSTKNGSSTSVSPASAYSMNAAAASALSLLASSTHLKFPTVVSDSVWSPSLVMVGATPVCSTTSG